MTHWRTSLLISVPILLGAAACGWAGVLQSVPGSIAASAVLVAYVGLACVWLNRPWAALADLAQGLTQGLASTGASITPLEGESDRQRLRQALQDTRNQIDADHARITELETQLAAARAAAARADDAKRAFLQSVGHELRTPLNAVIGMTQLSMQTSLSARQRDYLERADRSAHSLLRQIDGILDYVRLEAGDLQITHTTFNLVDVIDGVVDTAMHAAGDKPLTVRLECDPNIPGALVGDARRLGQVLTALADSIARTAEAGEIIVCARLLGINAGRAQVAFDVSSGGRDAERPRQAPRADVDASDQAAGTNRGGADLSIGVSHRLVAALGGRLQVEQRAPYGIRFGFTLPLALTANAQPSDPRLPQRLGQRPSERPSERQRDASFTAVSPSAVRRAGQPASARDASPSQNRPHPSRASTPDQAAMPSPQPRMDLKGIRRRLNGDSHLLRRLLLRFRTDHAHFADDYGSLFGADDRFGASQLARALESAAASLGAVELERSAARLATKRRADDDPSAELDHARHLLADLLAEIDDTLAGAVEPAMPYRSARSEPPRIDSAIAQALRHLSELLADFDAAAINHFEQLRPSLLGLVSSERIEDLQRAIHGFDFTLAQRRLHELAADLGVQVRAIS